MRPWLIGASLVLATSLALALGSLPPPSANNPSASATDRAPAAPTRTSDSAADVLVQPDGRIVVAGSVTTGYPLDPHGDIALARYTAAGAPDPAFGDAGRVTTDFAGRQDSASALALQGDGKLVVAGMTCLIAAGNASASPAAFDCGLALARYLPDGSLDAAFGSAGRVQMDFVSGHGNSASALAVQSDGKLIVAGSTWGAGLDPDRDFALARYNPDGTLDPAFGGDGVIISDFGGDDATTDIIVLPDGRIVAAGSSCCTEMGGRRFVLARYNPDGSFDAALDGDGRVVVDVPAPVWQFKLLPEGGAVGSGCSGNSAKTKIHVVRFNSAGVLDSGFGMQGAVTTDAGGTYQCAADAAVQSDGKIVVAGNSMGIHGGCMCYFLLVRYTGDGSLDAAFDGDGSLAVDFSERGMEGASTLAISPDGGILVAGSAAPYDGEPDLAVARSLGDGTLDAAFGAGGRVTTDFSGLLAATSQPVFRVLLPIVTR